VRDGRRNCGIIRGVRLPAELLLRIAHQRRRGGRRGTRREEGDGGEHANGVLAGEGDAVTDGRGGGGRGPQGCGGGR
jgi:hypothetical protein